MVAPLDVIKLALKPLGIAQSALEVEKLAIEEKALELPEEQLL